MSRCHLRIVCLATLRLAKQRPPHAADEDECPPLFTQTLSIIVHKAATLSQPLLMVLCLPSSCLSCYGWCVYFPDSQPLFFTGNVDRVLAPEPHSSGTVIVPGGLLSGRKSKVHF